MRTRQLLAAAAAALAATSARADCTLIADAADGRVMREEGACGTRITPASTFKIAIALMGYDAGFLTSEHAPVQHWRRGDVLWNPAWRADTDPSRWIRDSVVWYSQRVTAALGPARFARYAADFHYGNADVSGDATLHDGLRFAWIDSSLRISPREQLAFLRRVARCDLPVSAKACEMTARITAIPGVGDGWAMHAKTGAGFPVGADGRTDHSHGYGWFVGWASKGPRTFVFVRQTQDAVPHDTPAGLRARDAFLPSLPATLDAIAAG